MSFKIEIKKSNALNPENFANKLRALAQDKALGIARDRLAGISCPEHGTLPEPQLEPQAEGFQIRVSNICCSSFQELVRDKLKAA